MAPQSGSVNFQRVLPGSLWLAYVISFIAVQCDFEGLEVGFVRLDTSFSSLKTPPVRNGPKFVASNTFSLPSFIKIDIV